MRTARHCDHTTGVSKAQQPTVEEQTYEVNLLGVDVGRTADLDLGGVNGSGYRDASGGGGATDVTSAGPRLLVADGGSGGEGVHDARRTADRAPMVTALDPEESATARDR